MNDHIVLEFDKILEKLAENALSETVKARCLALVPSLKEAEVRRWMEETTRAKRILEETGTPPLPAMGELQKVLDLAAADAMLTPDQITEAASFLVSCRRMKAYLRKAEAADPNIASYGGSIDEMPDLEREIDRCIRKGSVDNRASSRLDKIRRQMDITNDQIRAKLDALLQKNKAWFSESFVSTRNGHYTLPVKREHKNSIRGTVIEMSNTGGTLFVEPTSVARLQAEVYALQIEEENEIRSILFSLTALIRDALPVFRLNIEAMETLDFLFAKGKLSLSMKASPVEINTGREIRMINARHPLLDQDTAVPLNFQVGGNTRGVVITGPNTGGKTVALKTVGLLSLMVQSGLHVPADETSSFCMHNLVLCDIGDGQSITENLSTFSAHIKNIIQILKRASHESLVLIDELGSGTDPTEGMGLAIAILDELCAKKCLFAVTTHYPEIKDYAAGRSELVNARMAFDKESLVPLYRLEMGEAGESCALYIAEKLGMPRKMLERAHLAAYGSAGYEFETQHEALFQEEASSAPKINRQKEHKPETATHKDKFNLGDSVFVYPQRELGIIYAPANDKGEVGVQIKGKKKLINHKRLKLHIAAEELYPEDYDLSIVFDSVANRKARHLMGKRHQEGNVVVIQEGEDGKSES